VTRVTWRLLATVQTATQALRKLIVPVGVLSASINTTPIVAMLIPAMKELQQTRGIPARQMLLPIAHATTLAGSITLVGTSSNLLIAGIAGSAGVSVGMFSFAPIALPVCLVGWVVLMVTAPRMFKAGAMAEPDAEDWLVELKVAENSIGIGRLPDSLGIESTQEYTLLAIRRSGDILDPHIPVEAGDTMVFSATEKGVTALWGSPRFGLSAQRLYAATVAPGQHGRIKDLEAEGDLNVIAAQGDVDVDAHEELRRLRDAPTGPGQTVFVTCEHPDALADSSAVALWQDAAGRVPQPGKTPLALAILIGVIVSATFGLVPVEIAAFTGALLMVLMRVITPTSAARALDWNVLFILAGSVGLGAIVVSSGIAAKIAEGITYLSAGSVPLVVVVIAVATAVLTNITTNAAAASILTPVALSIAAEMSLEPVILLALIGTCISFTFINPFSHQSNLMVLDPGGYSMSSFVRFGVPLFAVSLVTVCIVGYLLIA
ncbi:MAG: hypothetical protein QG597_642, partial [Actinomycetota bacterium]|nr:hypothetical protein [Actinomycetota bacterium]